MGWRNIGIKWENSVPTPGDLPAIGEAGEMRAIWDDGDTNPAIYGWKDTVPKGWLKIADPDASGLVTPVPIADGGTGSVSAAAARTALDVAQRFTGAHPIFDSPATLPTWVAKIDDTVKPHRNPSGLPAEIFMQTGGDDNDNTGNTVGSPLATIARIAQRVGRTNGALVTVTCGPGTFDLPAVLASLANVFWDGDVSNGDLLTISTVVTATDTDLLTFDVTSSGSDYAVDELEGAYWQGSGALSGVSGTIKRNDVTAGGITRIYTTDEASSLTSPVATNTLQIITRNTNFRLVGDTTFTDLLTVQFNKINVTEDVAGRTLFVLNSSHPGFLHCNLQIGRVQVDNGGNLESENSYYGGNMSPMISVLQGGRLRFARGNVLSGSNAGGNTFVNSVFGGELQFQGVQGARDLNTNGIRSQGGDVEIPGGDVAHTFCYFDDYGVSPTCDAGFRWNTAGRAMGGVGRLPRVHGTIGSGGSGHVITTQEGADVIVPTASTCATPNVSDGSGVMDSSATNGVTTTALDGGSRIEGAFPPIPDESQSIVSTTDATVTTLATITIPDTTTWHIEAVVKGRSAGARWVKRIEVAAHREGGGAVLGTVQDAYQSGVPPTGPWAITFTPSGNDVLVEVTGAAATPVTWDSWTRASRLNA